MGQRYSILSTKLPCRVQSSCEERFEMLAFDFEVT